MSNPYWDLLFPPYLWWLAAIAIGVIARRIINKHYEGDK